MIKKKLCIMLSIIACFCMGAMALMQFLPKTETVSAAVAGYGVNDFKMIDKAQVRVKERSGIRFLTFIGNDHEALTEEGYWDTHEMGTLFIPKQFMRDSDELVIGGTYSGKRPSTAKFNGDVSKLVEDSLGIYTDGRLFQAVISLDGVTAESAFNGAMVARTYIKDKTTGKVEYLDVAVKAPAYVASKELDAHVAGEVSYSDDQLAILDSYVSHAKISGVNADFNVESGVGVDFTASTNVYGLSVNYALDKGSLDNGVITGVSNDVVSVTASIAGGRNENTLKTFNVAVAGKTLLERKYYALEDENTFSSAVRNENSEIISFKAFDVTGVYYNGKALTENVDYSIDNATNSVVIEKALLVGNDYVSNITITSGVGDVSFQLILNYEDQELLPESFSSYFEENKFDIYSYHSLRKSDSVVDADGVKGGDYSEGSSDYNTVSTGIDFLSTESLADYFAGGNEKIIGGSVAGISSFDALPDNLQTVLDNAHAIGQDNSVIVTDGNLGDMDRLNLFNNYGYPNINLSLSDDDIATRDAFNKSIVYGDKSTYPTFISKTPGDYQYADTDKLDAYVEKCLSRYCYHPAFGGVTLRDEPNVAFVPLVGEIYKSVKRVYAKLGLEDKKINVVLLPMRSEEANRIRYVYNEGEWDNANIYKSYEQYLKLWFDCSGADEATMDIYSFYQAKIYQLHVLNHQIAASVANNYGAKINVLGASWQRTGSEREPTYQDFAWQNNLIMAYGAGNFGYYTYNTLDDTASQIVTDGYSPIARDGKKTIVYDYVREIDAKAQILAPVILNYKYNKTRIFSNDELATNSSYLTSKHYNSAYAYGSNGATAGATTAFNCISNVSASSKYSWLVNELVDEKNGHYMYAVMNFYDGLDNNNAQSITLTFKGEYTHAWVFRDGKFSVVELTSNQLALSDLYAGEACYVIPFNSSNASSDVVVKPDWGNDVWGDGSSSSGSDSVVKPGWGDSVWGDVIIPGGDSVVLPGWDSSIWG